MHCCNRIISVFIYFDSRTDGNMIPQSEALLVILTNAITTYVGIIVLLLISHGVLYLLPVIPPVLDL